MKNAFATLNRFGIFVVLGFLSIACFVMPAAAETYGIPEVAGSEFEEVQPPGNLRLVDSGEAYITVAWTSDVRSIVDAEQAAVATEYTVRVYEKKTNERVKTVVTDEMEVTVGGLERNRGYMVRVWAERNGFSSEASEIVARTSPASPRVLTASIVRRQIFHDVVSNKPLNQFGGSSMSAFLAYLSWEAPAGKVRYYHVDIYKKGSDEVVKSVETKKKFVAVGGLKVGATYAYVVTAHFNDEYASESSERVKFTVSREAAE